MSVLRAITKPLRDAYNNREELLEKAKEAPLLVLQTALSGVGHALLLGDRVRSTIKRLAGPEEEAPKPTQTAVDQLAAEEPQDAKATRREPVIFAPRPQKPQEQESEKTFEPERNGHRPEPVIFTPAKKVPAAAPDVEKAPGEPAEKPEETVAGGGRPPLPTVAPDLVGIAPEPEVVHPEITPEPAVAEPVVVEPTAVGPALSKTMVSEPTVVEPAVSEPVVAEEPAPAGQGEETSLDAAARKTSAQETLSEPIPGYATLTIASLRARMRGKSAEQLRELIAYESATAGRDEVVRMFAKRLAKVEAEL